MHSNVQKEIKENNKYTLLSQAQVILKLFFKKKLFFLLVFNLNERGG